MAIHSEDSGEPGEIKKKTLAKCYPQWELNLRLLTLVPCILLSELITYLLEV